MATWWVPIVTAAVAAATASIGFFLTNRLNVIDRRRAAYAKALLAVESYKQLPYRIRRRAGDTDEIRDTLGSAISDCERDLNYYMGLLDLDDKSVARRYRALASLVRIEGTKLRQKAWEDGAASGTALERFRETYECDDDYERNACRLAMLRQVRVLGLR